MKEFDNNLALLKIDAAKDTACRAFEEQLLQLIERAAARGFLESSHEHLKINRLFTDLMRETSNTIVSIVFEVMQRSGIEYPSSEAGWIENECLAYLENFIKYYVLKKYEHEKKRLNIPMEITELLSKEIAEIKKEALRGIRIKIHEYGMNIDGDQSKMTNKCPSTVDLNRITSKHLRAVIQRDCNELQEICAYSVPKAIIIMAGSVLEALCLSKLVESKNITDEDLLTHGILEKHLSDLIDDEEIKKMIPKEDRSLAHALRKYRNYIHPGLEIKSDAKIDFEHADAVLSFLNIMIKQLGYKRE